MNMSTGLNAIVFPIRSNVIIGVKIGEITVETAVSETESATSPFARNVITSDAVPPGTVPTRTSPTVNASFKDKMLAIANAINGINRYWALTPNKISLGLLNTFTKFSIFNVVPIPKRITPKRTLITFIPINSSITQLNEFGMITAITTAIRMIIKKYFSTNLKILFVTLIFVKSINKCLY